jgi:cytidylate kinase
MLASTLSARSAVRAYLLKIQRELGRQKAAVFEGRDMGTVVFPEAEVKFYLSASESTRALRRYAEIQTTTAGSLEEVQRDLRRRDEQDRRRTLAPLKPAEDAIRIDSSDLGIDEVVDLMMKHVRAAL